MKLISGSRTHGHGYLWGSGGFGQEGDNVLILFWLVGTQKHSHLIEMNRPISDDLCIFLRVFYDFVKKVYLKIVASSSSPLQRRFLH